MKTNKSFTKRIKVSKNGKLRIRKPGQNHFNAKESRRRTQLVKNRDGSIVMNQKARSQFLPNS